MINNRKAVLNIRNSSRLAANILSTRRPVRTIRRWFILILSSVIRLAPPNPQHQTASPYHPQLIHPNHEQRNSVSPPYSQQQAVGTYQPHSANGNHEQEPTTRNQYQQTPPSPLPPTHFSSLPLPQWRDSWNSEESNFFLSWFLIVKSLDTSWIGVEPDDERPLTPNHFLIGREYRNLPPEVFEQAKGDLDRNRWIAAQQMTDLFWRRWLREDLPNLMERPKWTEKNTEFGSRRLESRLLIVDHQTPRGQWATGRILRVLPGADGVIRNVVMEVGEKEFRRPVTSLCLLREADEGFKTTPAGSDQPAGWWSDYRKGNWQPGSVAFVCFFVSCVSHARSVAFGEARLKGNKKTFRLAKYLFYQVI